MKLPSKNISYFFCIALFSICLLSNAIKVRAASNDYFQITMLKDSMVADERTKTLFNNIKITNINNKHIRIAVEVNVPVGWKNLKAIQSIEGEDIYYNLAPDQSITIPVNLLKLPKATAIWEKVKVKVRLREVGIKTFDYFYNIRTLPKYTFNTRILTQEFNVNDSMKHVDFKAQIKNTGNIDDVYLLQFQNSLLGINDSIRIRLLPGQDTVYTYPVYNRKSKFALVSTEKLAFSVSGKGDMAYSGSSLLLCPQSVITSRRSAYDQIPIYIEGGLLSYGERINYYGGIRGRISFSQHSDVDFYYRSKQFSNVPTGYQQNLFRLSYRYKKWTLTAGQVATPPYFLINSVMGASLRYMDTKHEFSVTGTIHNPLLYYKNDNVTAFAKYKLGKFLVSNTAIVNNDLTADINSYVLINNVKLLMSENLMLGVHGGVGMDEKTRDVPGVQKNTFGGHIGYEFYATKNRLIFMSNADIYSATFPGINKGLKNYMFDIGWKKDNIEAGVYYTANYMKQNFFRDSLYNSDLFSYNTSQYGVRFTRATKKFITGARFGFMEQNGQTFMPGTSNRSLFVGINDVWRFSKTGSFSINMESAYSKGVDSSKDFLTLRANTTLSTRYVGFNMIYTRMPKYTTEDGVQKIKDYSETVFGGPFVNFYLFNNTLYGTLRYNVSKTLRDDKVSTGAGGSLNYNLPSRGLRIAFDCFIPIEDNQSTNDPGIPIDTRRSGQLTFTKQINVPVITKKKYHTLSLTLYEDDNNNGIRDSKEPVLQDKELQIGNEHFVTDKHGEIKYRNIRNDNYKMSFLHSNLNGLIPVNGNEQLITVFNNTSLDIPFKRGRLIKGNVNVITDSFSNKVMTSDQIKVIATDSAGNKYSTLTDAHGNFTLAVAAGIYNVALNQRIFDGTDFKPEKVSFKVDVTDKKEETLQYTIKQKARKVRFLNANDK